MTESTTEANAAWLEWQGSEHDWTYAVLSDWTTERTSLNRYRRSAHRTYIAHLDMMGEQRS